MKGVGRYGSYLGEENFPGPRTEDLEQEGAGSWANSSEDGVGWGGGVEVSEGSLTSRENVAVQLFMC